MRRWLILSVTALAAVAGYGGFRLGQAGPLSETDVINHWAGHYVRQAGPGAQVTDCAARPHPSPDIWLELTCAPQGGPVVVLPVAHDGRLIPQAARHLTKDLQT